jgi:hypothetical protein
MYWFERPLPRKTPNYIFAYLGILQMAMRLMLPELACLGGTTVPATHGDDPPLAAAISIELIRAYFDAQRRMPSPTDPTSNGMIATFPLLLICGRRLNRDRTSTITTVPMQLNKHALLGPRNVVHQTLMHANNRSLVGNRKRTIECAGTRPVGRHQCDDGGGPK